MLGNASRAEQMKELGPATCCQKRGRTLGGGGGDGGMNAIAIDAVGTSWAAGQGQPLRRRVRALRHRWCVCVGLSGAIPHSQSTASGDGTIKAAIKAACKLLGDVQNPNHCGITRFLGFGPSFTIANIGANLAWSVPERVRAIAEVACRVRCESLVHFRNHLRDYEIGIYAFWVIAIKPSHPWAICFVCALEWQEELPQVKVQVPRSITCVHVNGQSSSADWVQVEHCQVHRILWVDLRSALQCEGKS